MKKTYVKDIYDDTSSYMGKDVTLKGWIKNHRKQKEFGFIDFSDGTHFLSVQVVYDESLSDFNNINKYHVGSSLTVVGKIITSPKEGQEFEIQASKIILEGDCPENYPIQPKRHTREFLREQAYLRPRVNLFQAVFRIRSVAAYAIHSYFQENNYIYLHSPLITGVDGEGTGEMFNLTTFDLDNLPKNEDGKVDYKEDLFGKKVSLTGTGQLHGEAFALAFNRIYTFGPTFRTEKSNTKTHANEFWMIEPEISFCDLEELMNIEEDMLKYIVKYVLEKCNLEIDFLDQFVEVGLKKKLSSIISSNFKRVSHKEIIDILLSSGKVFEVVPSYEDDIAKEHERFLVDEHFKSPVFVTNWPKDIKAFYMRGNEDNKTVAAVDLLVPGAGELMGGSQREERLEVLIEKMKKLNMDENALDWYINLRRYGGCVHSGFGMGFERLIIYLTGIDNIRDVIPFPRTPKSCEF